MTHDTAQLVGATVAAIVDGNGDYAAYTVDVPADWSELAIKSFRATVILALEMIDECLEVLASMTGLNTVTFRIFDFNNNN